MWALGFSPGCEKAEHVYTHVSVLCMGGRVEVLLPYSQRKKCHVLKLLCPS